MRCTSLFLLALAVVGLSTSAWAGTKYQANLVPVGVLDPNDPNGPGTLANKSKIQAQDSGKFQANLKGVVDGAGALITTDGSFKATGTLTGDEFIVVVAGTFPGVDNIAFEFNLVGELKKGNGKAAIDASSLFNQIPPSTLRSVVITGVEVHGPLGAENIEACTQNLVDGGFNLPDAAPNPCVGGSLIGAAGIQIP